MATTGSWAIVVEGFGNIANNAGASDVEVAFKNFLAALKTAGHKLDQARLMYRGGYLANTCEDNLLDPAISASYSAGTER